MTDIDRTSKNPIYIQVSKRLRTAIADGTLRPGDRVPSARSLAAQMGIARGTVDLAYSVLLGEGYFVANGPRGTFVSPLLPPRTGREKKGDQCSLSNSPAPERLPAPGGVALNPGAPALDLFPRKVWSKLISHNGRRLSTQDLSYPTFSGDQRIRRALVAYLAVSRGVICSPEQVIITGGYQSALALASRLLLNIGDKVWIEDPGYPATRLGLVWAGAVPVPVPVDREGLAIERVLATTPKAALCIVTPSNQFPLGVSLSLSRRMSLLDWASLNKSWILEDDYDSEFYFDRRPLPALKSLDLDDRVFYTGTFSKTLFPGLRLGYIVVPASQTERFQSAARFLEGGRSVLDQAVVADFLEQGYFARHLRKMRAAYKDRRLALIAALRAEMHNILQVEVNPAGLHILARLKAATSDVDLVAKAARSGFRPLALSSLTHSGESESGLVMGFANVPVLQAERVVMEFSKTLRLEI